MKKLITITILLLSLIKINAQTTVNSYNANDSVWEKSNSPYYITGNINVPTNRSLKIEPGVKVVFKGNYSILIQGKISFNGLQNEKVLFVGDSLSPSTKVLWGKIDFRPSNQSPLNISINHIIIKNSNGIVVTDANIFKFKIQNSEFFNNNKCLEIDYNLAYVDSIVNCKFENNYLVFEEINQTASILDNSKIENNDFLYAKGAIFFNKIIDTKITETGISRISSNDILNSEFLNLKNCQIISANQVENSIFNNQLYPNEYDLNIVKELKNSTMKYLKRGAVTNSSSISNASINGNIFISNDIGVELSSSNNLSNTVNCNKFINNKIGLKYSQNQQDIVQNNYFCNYDYDVVNTSSQAQNLTQNYFCSDSIENKIYDKSDLNSLGAINYNLYNPSLQFVIKVVAKDKSILTASDTTAAIDTACVSKRSYFDIALNTKDTICHQINTVYISVQPTVLNSTYPINQISLTKTYPVNGPVNANVQGLYIEEYKATDPSGNFVTKRRYILVKTNCTSAQTLFIDLNTPDTICHKVNTSYNSVLPSVSSTIYPSTQLSLQFISSSVNPNVLGLYIEEFKAMDPSGTTVIKRRFVRVSDTCGINTSNKSVFSNGFNIYPNPSHKDLNIITTTEKEIKVTLMDAVGKMIEVGVYSGSLFYTIDTKNYIDGAYFIRIEIDNQIWTNKMIISH